MPLGQLRPRVPARDEDPSRGRHRPPLDPRHRRADQPVQHPPRPGARDRLPGEPVLQAPRPLQHHHGRQPAQRGRKIRLVREQQRRLGGRREKSPHDATGGAVRGAEVREESAADLRHAVQGDPAPGFLLRETVARVRVHRVDLVAARRQQLRHLGRVTVPAAIDVRRVAEGEEDEAHRGRSSASKRSRPAATRLRPCARNQHARAPT